jgi:hypothetical protein
MTLAVIWMVPKDGLVSFEDETAVSFFSSFFLFFSQLITHTTEQYGFR